MIKTSDTIELRAWYESPYHRGMLYIGDDKGTTNPLDCAKYKLDGQPVTLMLWSGEKDTKDTKIFASDIVKVEAHTDFHGCYEPESIHEITFEEGCFWAGKFELYSILGKCEVIGNKYENPDLL